MILRKESKEIYCSVCKRKIDTANTEYIEDPIDHTYRCLSCFGAAMDELLERYPTAIAD